MARIVRTGGSGISWPYASLQAGIDATPTNGTLLVPPLTFAEAVSVSRGMSILCPEGAATITGSGTRTSWMHVNASNVTIDGFRMQNAASGAYQSGSLAVDGSISNVTLRNLNCSGGSYGALAIWIGPNGVHVFDSIFDSNPAIGAISWQANNLDFTRCTFSNNNLATVSDPGNDAGGIKNGNGSGYTFDSCVFSGNNGPGLWQDVSAQSLVVFGSNAHHNTRPGIMFEICDGASIHDNVVWRNGAGLGAFAGGAGIYISSSRNADVYNNVIAYNEHQIVVSSQNRGTDGAIPSSVNWNSVLGNSIHANDVIALSGKSLLEWVQDFAGILFSNGTNTGASNRYWHADTEPTPAARFAWNGNLSTLSGFNATPGEEGGTYMSTATKDGLLATYGIS